MRIALTIPRSGFLIDERVFPSLGVLKVAATLEHAGHEVKIIDLSGMKDPMTPFLGAIEKFKPDVVGITATMPQMPEAVELADAIPWITKVLGGPHPTLLRASERKGSVRAKNAVDRLFDHFDIVVAGDGEKAILEAIKPFAPQLIDADDVKSPYYMHPEDLENAPLPSRHLIDIDSYHYQIDGLPTMSMIAQLGCPFGCVFCGGRSSPFLRKVRTRSTNAVIREMEHLYLRYGNRGFMFLDDELNVNKNFMQLLGAINDLQEKYHTEFRLRGLLKSELVTKEMSQAMYRAGFRQVLIGFESGHDRILKTIQKKATVDDNTRCVETLNSAGIRVKALMSFGHAGETVETMRATEDWLIKVQPDDFDVTIITVYPGTPYYDDSTRHTEGVWKYKSPITGDVLYIMDVDPLKEVAFYKGRPNEYEAFVFTDECSPAILKMGRDSVEANVRTKLSIPYPTSSVEKDYEHSMGMR